MYKRLLFSSGQSYSASTNLPPSTSTPSLPPSPPSISPSCSTGTPYRPTKTPSNSPQSSV